MAERRMKMISITAVGRLTADVELRKSSKGTLFGSFDLAVSKGFGEKQHTVYLNCMCFGSAAERMSNANVKKESLIMITGDLDFVEFTVVMAVKAEQIRSCCLIGSM